MSHMIGLLLATTSSLLPHPRLFLSPSDVPALRNKVRRQPYFVSLLEQFEAALEGRLNYSAGGVMTPPQDFQRVQLASALYLARGSNASSWGDYAKHELMSRVLSIAKACQGPGGCGFAANQREIQQLISCYDVTVRALDNGLCAPPHFCCSTDTRLRRSIPTPAA